jgi:hypothetical protein
VSTFGQPLGNEEFVAYVLIGLDEEFYNPLVSSIVARAEPISPSELYFQMLSYELHVNKHNDGNYSSANSSSMGRSTHGPVAVLLHHVVVATETAVTLHHSMLVMVPLAAPTSGTVLNAASGQNRPHCQVCYRVGHTAGVCWYLFDEEFIPDYLFFLLLWCHHHHTALTRTSILTLGHGPHHRRVRKTHHA